MITKENLQLLPQKCVAELFGVSGMTLWRWQLEPNFPTPISHKGRKFFRATEIFRWQESHRGNAGQQITNANTGRKKSSRHYK